MIFRLKYFLSFFGGGFEFLRCIYFQNTNFFFHHIFRVAKTCESNPKHHQILDVKYTIIAYSHLEILFVFPNNSFLPRGGAPPNTTFLTKITHCHNK